MNMLVIVLSVTCFSTCFSASCLSPVFLCFSVAVIGGPSLRFAHRDRAAERIGGEGAGLGALGHSHLLVRQIIAVTGYEACTENKCCPAVSAGCFESVHERSIAAIARVGRRPPAPVSSRATNSYSLIALRYFCASMAFPKRV